MRGSMSNSLPGEPKSALSGSPAFHPAVKSDLPPNFPSLLHSFAIPSAPLTAQQGLRQKAHPGALELCTKRHCEPLDKPSHFIPLAREPPSPFSPFPPLPPSTTTTIRHPTPLRHLTPIHFVYCRASSSTLIASCIQVPPPIRPGRPTATHARRVMAHTLSGRLRAAARVRVRKGGPADQRGATQLAETVTPRGVRAAPSVPGGSEGLGGDSIQVARFK